MSWVPKHLRLHYVEISAVRSRGIFPFISKDQGTFISIILSILQWMYSIFSTHTAHYCVINYGCSLLSVQKCDYRPVFTIAPVLTEGIPDYR